MKKPGAWPDSLPVVGDLSSPWAVLGPVDRRRAAVSHARPIGTNKGPGLQRRRAGPRLGRVWRGRRESDYP